MARTRTRGFTIKELLCVVGIIIFSTAIALPYINHDPRGPQIDCAENLKQIGLGLTQYSQDYDLRLPPRQSNVGGGRVISWRKEIYPYVESIELFRCPTNKAASMPDIEHDGLSRSYAVNSTGPFTDSDPYRKLSSIPHPEATIAVVESTAAYNDFNVLFPAAFERPTRADRNYGHLFTGHDQGANFLVLDDHVKWMHPLDTLGMPGGSGNMWTSDNSTFAAHDLTTAKAVLRYVLKECDR